MVRHSGDRLDDEEDTHVATAEIANRRIGLRGFEGVTMAMKEH
jgi:hypothetical protein